MLDLSAETRVPKLIFTGVVKWGPTMCRAKRFVRTFKAVEAGLVLTDLGMCKYQNRPRYSRCFRIILYPTISTVCACTSWSGRYVHI